MDYLIVVDMQNDFIDGSLSNSGAQAIVGRVAEKIGSFNGKVIFTRDTHSQGYLATQEGRKLPVEHCIKGTQGWQLNKTVACAADGEIIDKPTFGSVELAQSLSSRGDVTGITLIGICTDICVISNAFLLKAFLPEVPVTVDASCCAGVSEQSHRQALEAMKACQIGRAHV